MNDEPRRQATERFAQQCLHRLIVQLDRPLLVNIGCNDGMTGDPFFPHLMQAGEKITGIYCDPVWEYGETIAFLKHRCPDLWFFPIAVSDSDGEVRFRYIPPSLAYRLCLEDWAAGCGSLHDQPEMSGPYAEHFETTHVPTRRWDDFLTESLLLIDAVGRQVDALNIDAEGHELAIVPQIDFSSIKWAQIELRHVPAEKQGPLFRDVIDSETHVILGGTYDAFVIERELYQSVRNRYLTTEAACA